MYPALALSLCSNESALQGLLELVALKTDRDR